MDERFLELERKCRNLEAEISKLQSKPNQVWIRLGDDSKGAPMLSKTDVNCDDIEVTTSEMGYRLSEEVKTLTAAYQEVTRVWIKEQRVKDVLLEMGSEVAQLRQSLQELFDKVTASRSFEDGDLRQMNSTVLASVRNMISAAHTNSLNNPSINQSISQSNQLFTYSLLTGA